MGINLFGFTGASGGSATGAGGSMSGLLFGQQAQTPPPAQPPKTTTPIMTMTMMATQRNTVNSLAQSSSHTGYEPNKDLNGDGKITEADYDLQKTYSMVA